MLRCSTQSHHILVFILIQCLPDVMYALTTAPEAKSKHKHVISLFKCLLSVACVFSPVLCQTQCLFSVDNALMRSCMKMYRKPPLMSICPSLNNTLCSPKASRNTTVLILPPLPVFDGNRLPVVFSEVSCMYKGPVNPRMLNPAALDAHPADVMIFTSLASSHQAVLRSPRLNELSSPVAGGRGMVQQLL